MTHSVHHSQLRETLQQPFSREVQGIDKLPPGASKCGPSSQASWLWLHQCLHLPSLHSLSGLGRVSSASVKEQGKEHCSL